MTLVLTGLANGFRVEADKTVDSLGCRPLPRQGGRHRSVRRVVAVRAGRTPESPGARSRCAVPLAYGSATTARSRVRRAMSTCSARRRTDPGMPRYPRADHRRIRDEVAVSSTMRQGHRRRGRDRLAHLRIVGIVDNSTALANLPNVFLTTEGAQQLVSRGQPLVASIGVPGTLEAGAPRISHVGRNRRRR